MCGRLSRYRPVEYYVESFAIDSVAEGLGAPRYNIGPGQFVDAVVSHAESLRLGPMLWGFHAPFETKLRPFNARAESVATSRMFAAAVRHHRCWVLADGFYEWRREGKRKVPFYFSLRSGKPMALAAVWSFEARSPQTRVATCAVLTCPPNAVVSPVHDRMPVILAPGSARHWLAEELAPEDVVGLLHPLPPEDLVAYEVSPLVNSTANDSPQCIEPVCS